MTRPLSLGSLFAGIGGLDLGLERAGMEVRWQVELDGYCRRVLEKHWPNVTRYEDVRDVGAHNLERVDVVCGGFPCQDISQAGKRAGIGGEQSGLWREFVRIVCELRPLYAVVENAAALLLPERGLGRVLGDLAEGGYDAEWDCIPAAAVGAWHYRDRVFIVAYPNRERPAIGTASEGGQATLRHRNGNGARDAAGRTVVQPRTAWLDHPAADSGREGCQNRRPQPAHVYSRPPNPSHYRQWETEPRVGRVVHGVPNRAHRISALGNAAVPQVAEYIGRLIVSHAEQQGRGAVWG